MDLILERILMIIKIIIITTHVLVTTHTYKADEITALRHVFYAATFNNEPLLSSSCLLIAIRHVSTSDKSLTR
jgi:hypothetical protein